ncbi:MAG: thiolase [Dehalococcoidia bacterium]|nr:thiolase [Dehalococcoidia bacterium]
MSLRGKAAIVGFGELPSTRNSPGRTTLSLLAEVSKIAIRDAGLRKDDIDGLITQGGAGLVDSLNLAEYMGLTPVFSEGLTTHGASGQFGVQMAAAAVELGFATNVLITIGMSGDKSLLGPPPFFQRPDVHPGIQGEWEAAFGPVVAMNGWYGLLKQRHMYQYGTTDRQFAKIAANQRFNALTNPNALFKGQPISVDDVLNSRYTTEPIHLLECVLPCAGAFAVIVTTAERARVLPNPPVYVLGAGGAAITHEHIWQKKGDITVTPIAMSAPKAFQMARYGPKDIQFAEMYD